MKNFYPLFFLLFSFVFLSNLEAQKSVPGYIVTTERDTVRGFITDRTDYELGKEVLFKSEQNGPAVKYDPSALAGFGFDYKRIFESVLFTDKQQDTIQVFAKRVLDGRIKMLLWRKNYGKDFEVFLFNHEPEKMVHLTKPVKTTIEREDGTKAEVEKSDYIGLLKYVKADSSFSIEKDKRMYYSENRIKKEVETYNNANKEKFPVSRYLEKTKRYYSFTFGKPVINSPSGTSYRFAAYMNTYFVEKNMRFSYLCGVSFRYWCDKDQPGDWWRCTQTYRKHYLSLIPFGIGIQHDEWLIRPFFYCGFGVVFMGGDDYVFEKYEIIDEESYMFVPQFAINLGFGARIKTGPGAIVFEITPTGNHEGTYANVGFLF
ncbi:MAG TPA: hypothetical protein PKJ28_04170 [Bacteroidales bacterium]|nr:hypothetical protein [Bacteroidales bacterium]HPS73606.1 hypothetical protein [Bacteroidales bacterium]